MFTVFSHVVETAIQAGAGGQLAATADVAIALEGMASSFPKAHMALLDCVTNTDSTAHLTTVGVDCWPQFEAATGWLKRARAWSAVGSVGEVFTSAHIERNRAGLVRTLGYVPELERVLHRGGLMEGTA